MKNKDNYWFILFLIMAFLWFLTTISFYGMRAENKDLKNEIRNKNQQIVTLEDYASNLPVVIRYATEEEQKEHDKEIIDMLAKTVWGEARGCGDTQKAAVVWCILNRVDSDRFPNDIKSVIEQTNPNQFKGYNESYPVEEEIVNLVEDVLIRYGHEKNGDFVGSSGRVLPKEYLFFRAKDGVNVYRTGNSTTDYWAWAWGTPYNS